MPERRFPPPWSVEELDACFVVRDHNGQQLAYVYFEDEPGRRTLTVVARFKASCESKLRRHYRMLDEFLKTCDKSVAVSRYVPRDEER
jgi:hypothetical protein